MDFTTKLRGGVRAVTTLALLAATAPFATGQTLNLADSSSTVLRGGTYANTIHASDALLVTRASSDATYERRIVLKFDTQNTIPLGTPIASAVLTLTVRGGNPETRTVSTYRILSSFEEAETTWNRRNVSATWASAGGELGERYGATAVTNVAGARVSFDVTALVQGTVNGTFGSSRYSRIALLDRGASSRDSYKEYFSDETADATVRPLLTVTYGTAPALPAPPPTPGATLRVLDWNIHHGVGTDGVYNIDRIATAIARTSPHVVSLNEVERFTGWGYEDQPARFAALLAAKTGRPWYYNFASKTGTANGAGNLLLSIYPLDSSADYRISNSSPVAQARITVNGRTLTLLSVHLDPSSTTLRTTQIEEVKRYAASFPESRIIAGDFNAWPGAAEIKGFATIYLDTWAVAKLAGTAVAYAGNEAGNTRNSRIDYIWVSRGATNVVVKGAQVFDFRAANGVMPSDHRPVLGIYEIR